MIFFNRCLEKYPTIVFVKTIKGDLEDIVQFLGDIFIISGWEIKKVFIFSLDKQYNIKKLKKAIQTSYDYFGCFYIHNGCSSYSVNYNNNSGTYNTTEIYEINRGEKNFLVLS